MQFLESVSLALEAIWANKLRSLLTVLGNIVAVTSIITVVSLIQGMNAMVSTAIISDVGADSFTIQRQPPIRNEEDEERTRNNPILTMAEADAIRAFSPLVTAVMGQTGRGGTVSYRDTELSQVSIQAVTDEYVNFSNFNAERGRLMSPTEVKRAAPVVVIGYDTAERLIDPRYYGSEAARDAAFARIRARGCSFLVAGRAIDGVARTLRDLHPPGALRDLFVELPEALFRVDVSSTELRGVPYPVTRR